MFVIRAFDLTDGTHCRRQIRIAPNDATQIPSNFETRDYVNGNVRSPLFRPGDSDRAKLLGLAI
ncbi:hypothetical protein HG15A2_04900 [Adhaeretor mobilis]|uniref:Uncharacterized protein n=1 Tax=Adhaeretor mobilis TaxID=1930276 RepID=A0A517MQS3_9BACT|nr:hypothetical protein HG15A2_04900 [Adhaeretor mobilis]